MKDNIVKLKPGDTFWCNVLIKMSVDSCFYEVDKVILSNAIERFAENYIKTFCKKESNEAEDSVAKAEGR